jgi:pimeloyl-ACP methyl ester carboxylesterase
MTHFTTSDGLKLYYEDTGSGQPVLCLAGLTRNVRDFDFVKPHLTGYRMIAMDYRGRGLSEFDPNYANYNVMREGQDAVELLAHLGLDKVTILGTSRGGMIAMGLAAMQKDKVAGIILNDIGPEISAAGVDRIMDYVGKPPMVKTLADAAAALEMILGPDFPGIAKDVWYTLAKAQFVEVENGLAHNYDVALRDALIEQAAAGPAPDLWPMFAMLTSMPMGVIRGSNSDILTAETLTKMHDTNPNMISATIPDRGHVPLLDEPQSVDIINRIMKASA